MSEISSITPIHPTLKPVKIRRDEDSLSKRHQSGEQHDLDHQQHAAPEQHEQDAKPIEYDQDAQPIQHIDEIV